jgi:hypothetical protein
MISKKRYKSKQTCDLKPRTNNYQRSYRYKPRVPKFEQRLVRVASLQNDVKNLLPRYADLEQAYKKAEEFEDVDDNCIIQDFKYFILMNTCDDRTLAITFSDNNVKSAIPEMYIDTIVTKVYQDLGIKTSPTFDLETFITQMSKFVFTHNTLTQSIYTFVNNKV